MSGKKISLPVANSEVPTEGAPKTRAEGGDVQSEIAREVTENKVVLYMKGSMLQPMCGFSARAASILGSYGVPVHSVNILQDAEKRQGIKTFSEWPTIPQVYVGGEFLGGGDDLAELHESGELAEMIKEAFEA